MGRMDPTMSSRSLVTVVGLVTIFGACWSLGGTCQGQHMSQLAEALVPPAHPHAFEPFSLQAVGRFWGIGPGRGFHAVPCGPYQARFHHSVSAGGMPLEPDYQPHRFANQGIANVGFSAPGSWIVPAPSHSGTLRVAPPAPSTPQRSSPPPATQMVPRTGPVAPLTDRAPPRDELPLPDLNSSGVPTPAELPSPNVNQGALPSPAPAVNEPAWSDPNPALSPGALDELFQDDQTPDNYREPTLPPPAPSNPPPGNAMDGPTSSSAALRMGDWW